MRCNIREEIAKHCERMTKIKPFISNYNWEGTHFPLEKNDWKKFEKNNVTVTVTLNVLHGKKKKYIP